MRVPNDKADKPTAKKRAAHEARSCPIGKRTTCKLDRHESSDQQQRSESHEGDASHAGDNATAAPQGEALAIIGAQLGDSVRAFRRTRDPRHQANIARLTELLMETPVRTHADLLALSSVTWAVLSVPFDQPLPGFPPVDAREAILAAAPVLNRAIAALEADTGIGAEAFTGADLPAVN